ncbi:hypothetical protein KZZ52_49215 [Dactylosporangium sp. AC04546]|uniref:hypothetical protein n=1 Tax=Dactylosporangium sp. AC04546 TaxID=2862460 RepID=UPI001EDD25DF|nr:hypothetical protein [Dactylosporangium sp. AC04546]WVK81869.1 hypothetical protein KZZ52_49215 [Dactylosporangium sp. AC04546]
MTGSAWVMITERSLLVYCSANQALRCAPVADRHRGGLVVSPHQRDEAGLLATAAYLLRQRGFAAPLLLDAARYAGQARLPASAPFNPRWLRRQRELGLPVLTDSGYVDADDERGLAGLLHRAAAVPGAIAVLPLHPSWLHDRMRRAVLTGHVRAAAVPVALVLEAARDPFALPGVVAGLLALLRCEVPVLLLRSDVSALGALCHGATAAAVGTVGALRHLAPRYDVRGPVPRPPPSTVFRPTLSYRRLGAIARAKRGHPEPALWGCGCEACDGRDVDWMAGLPERDREVPAFEHAIRVLQDLRGGLLGDSVPLAAARRSWAARCADAVFRSRELGWAPAPMLTRWREETPAAAPVARLTA